MGYGVKVEVWGDYALFTRPEMKVERVSYDVMTPSAARGLIEAVFWHPGLKRWIDKIHVLAPIRFTNVRRNEVKAKVLGSNVKAAIGGGDTPLYISTVQNIQQRASLVLRDVRYVIEAHFKMTDRAAPETTRANLRTPSAGDWSTDSAITSPISVPGSFRPASAPGKGRRSPPLTRPGTWAICSMIWTTQSPARSSPCFSGPPSNGACWT